MNETLTPVVSRADGKQDEPPATDSTATRHLCVGVYVDRSFRDRIIRRVHNDARHRLAPSYGFDLVPVVRHAWWSWLLDTAYGLAIVGILFTGLLMGELLAIVVVSCAVAAGLLLWVVVRDAPGVVQQYLHGVAKRWGFRPDPDRLRARGQNPKAGKRLRVMFAGVLLLAAVPFVVSMVLDAPLTTAVWPAVVIALALATCAVVTGIVRQLLLVALAHAETLRPKTLTPRERHIAEQQDHLLVIYPRPPHKGTDDDVSPFGLLTRTDTPSPFLGAGKVVGRWTHPIAIQLLRPGDGGLAEREYTTPPFATHQLVEALRTALNDLRSDRGRHSLPGLQVHDRIYIAGADFPGNRTLLRRNIGKLEIRQVIDEHQSARDYFLETSAPILGGELVATVLIKVTLVGRSLTLNVAMCALTRTREKYHRVRRGFRGVLRSAMRSVREIPADVRLAWQPVELPVVVWRALWAQRDRTATPRRTSRPMMSVREEVADAWDNAEQDHNRILAHMKIIEQRILKAVEDFLRDHHVDTSMFEKQATNIINSGVLNMGGSQMTVDQMVAGFNAQLNNSGQGDGGNDQ